MKNWQNENATDRWVRVILGIIFLLLAYFQLTGTWRIVFYVLGIIALVTALTGFCALYKLLGINTNKKVEAAAPKPLDVEPGSKPE
ncbi:MAG: DUF2892 domain-containing protein [Patescibacteria group bacterium]